MRKELNNLLNFDNFKINLEKELFESFKDFDKNNLSEYTKFFPQSAYNEIIKNIKTNNFQIILKKDILNKDKKFLLSALILIYLLRKILFLNKFGAKDIFSKEKLLRINNILYNIGRKKLTTEAISLTEVELNNFYFKLLVNTTDKKYTGTSFSKTSIDDSIVTINRNSTDDTIKLLLNYIVYYINSSLIKIGTKFLEIIEKSNLKENDNTFDQDKLREVIKPAVFLGFNIMHLGMGKEITHIDYAKSNIYNYMIKTDITYSAGSNQEDIKKYMIDI